MLSVLDTVVNPRCWIRVSFFLLCHRLVGLVVKASASRAAGLGSNPVFPVGDFPGRVIPSYLICPVVWLTVEAPL